MPDPAGADAPPPDRLEVVGKVAIVIRECPHANTANEWLWGKVWRQVKYMASMRKSVTPKYIADAITAAICQFCPAGKVFDAFCGVGGQTVSLAAAGLKVWAIDIDQNNVNDAHHNASAHGVLERVRIACGDFFDGVARLASKWQPIGKKFAAMHIDMPWGPAYATEGACPLDRMGADGKLSAYEVLEVASRLSDSLVFKGPRTMAISDVVKLAYHLQSLKAKGAPQSEPEIPVQSEPEIPVAEAYVSRNKTHMVAVYMGEVAANYMATLPAPTTSRNLTRRLWTVEQCVDDMRRAGKAVGLGRVAFEPRAP
ncbi:unnamed protein product [Vitrella brassicaformis CCMP3155]|uniref:Trimethylguanosine synthase n=1 Tax=Vitrella brassicaformis (strain CCMP3155) TaxID=1169540 RepID=A0A0G4ELE4_VITBC|nr:unnamed protein product [Vitrella brassicaformis CCMP3155]|eukprot:CEL97772.1 unnamed protein product [Vitrella brassicaformis CCMP3155]